MHPIAIFALCLVGYAISQTCVDLTNPQTGVSDCPSRAYLCNNSIYYTLMTQQCPRTCNRCSSITITNIGGLPAFDSFSNGIFTNSAYSNECLSRKWFLAVPTSTSTTCVDLTNPSTGVSDCPSRAYLCNNTIYFTLMTQQCPRTCNRCSTTTTNTTTSVVTSTTTCGSDSRCAGWITNGFCNSTFYTTAQRQQYCGISCGLCTGK